MHRRSILDPNQSVASSQRRIRHAQDNVLPRSAAKLDRSEETLSQSIGRQLESTQRILDPDVGGRVRPPAERDCLDCGVAGAMKLQNITGTQPTNIPLLYVCAHCGTMLTIPPRESPLTNQ